MTTPPANQELLDEVARAQGWFHARKTQPIWAKRLEADQTVETLEGTEQVTAGTFLCRGEAGDVWPQRAERLESNYQATEELDADGWRKYVPRPDAEGVLAARVPHPFTVESRWGQLTGKAGDYLLKNFSDKNVPYPDDVWIVDQTLFAATYQRVTP